MVLDVKALSWAAQNDIDTAKLKAAKVPIYGKWYFPEIPANVPLVNLETGERRTFPQRMIAGEVIWVAEADLRRARLGPFGGDGGAAATAVEEAAPAQPAAGAAAEPPPPTIALSRPPAAAAAAAAAPEALALASPVDAGPPPAVHLPRPSIAPFVLGVGISITLLGLITHPLVLAVGLAWTVVGAIGWVRIGLHEARDSHRPDHT